MYIALIGFGLMVVSLIVLILSLMKTEHPTFIFLFGVILVIIGCVQLGTDNIHKAPVPIGNYFTEVDVLLSDHRYKKGWWVVYKQDGVTKETRVPCENVPIGKHNIQLVKMQHPGNVIAEVVVSSSFCSK